MFRSALARLERNLRLALPAILYCEIDDIVRPLLNPARRGGKRRKTARDEAGYCVQWDDGSRFYFAYKNRHHRYVWPDGADHIFAEMLDKYQDGPVHLRPGDIVIEAGANVGEFSCASARIANHVYAVEPDPVPLACLIKNAKINKNITIESRALGASSGTVQFYLSGEGADSSVFRPRTWTNIVEVEVITVPWLMKKYNIGMVGFLKVEAEGYEPEILQGCGDGLKRIRAVAVDCSPERNGESPFPQCEALLNHAGFKTWKRQRGNTPMLFGLNSASGA